MKFTLCLFAALLWTSCSEKGNTVKSEPAGKRISSSITFSEPVAGTSEGRKRMMEEKESMPDSGNAMPDTAMIDTTMLDSTVMDTTMVSMPDTAMGDTTIRSEITWAGFTVSGTITNETEEDLPDSARVVVFWTSDTGEGDYTYVYGSGGIDLETGTFTLEFEKAPPMEALLADVFGVGALVVVADNSLEEGILDDDYSGTILGASPRHHVVFSRRDEEALEKVPWLQPFKVGYTVGRGIQVPDYSFDGFEPVDASAVEIIIDDLANQDFVNWS